ncbi:MAG: hypothetical protein ABI543_12395 [Ignavibacteria bacterium]
MKRTIISVLVFLTIGIISMAVSGAVSEQYGCDCTGSPEIITVCKPESCPGPNQTLDVFLIDETCNTVIDSCTISGSSNCCTIPASACSNHSFHVNYGQPFGSVCQTGSFTPSGSSYKVTINCTCP